MGKTVKNRKVKINLGSFKNILGGSFLTNKTTRKNFSFLLFLAFLGIIYIGNSYYGEKNIRKVERMQKELRELRYKHISTKAKLMQGSRQSKVAATLEKKGIKESTVPPKKIIELD